MPATLGKTYYIVEGTSEPQDFQIWDHDNEEAEPGTGLTVAIKVYSNGTLITSSPPTVAWLSQAGGTVRVSGVENLAAGEYRVRFTLTDTNSKVGFVPGGPLVSESDRWIVKSAYA
jgi:hypothetical protein